MFGLPNTGRIRGHGNVRCSRRRVAPSRTCMPSMHPCGSRIRSSAPKGCCACRPRVITDLGCSAFFASMTRVARGSGRRPSGCHAPLQRTGSRRAPIPPRRSRGVGSETRRKRKCKGESESKKRRKQKGRSPAPALPRISGRCAAARGPTARRSAARSRGWPGCPGFAWRGPRHCGRRARRAACAPGSR